MNDNAAFVSGLRQANDHAHSVEACAVRAVAQFDIYRTQMYRALNIDAAKRPTTTAKMTADCILNDLRHRLLKAESESAEPLRTTLAAVRHRVDTVRRALAMHMAEDDMATAPLIGAYEWPRFPTTMSIAVSARSGK
jgi:hypothetical protein